MKYLVAVLFLMSVTWGQEPSKSKFVALTAGSAIVTGIDAWQTSRPGRETGSPWLYGTYPCDHVVKLGLIHGAEFGLSSYLGWRMQRSHNKLVRKLWWIPQSVVIQAHTKGMIGNFRRGQY